ncbi:zinc ribbon domain-containing protein [Halolamina sp. CBA1230]|uniref:DUF7575 domain-containing protein n=1 Tax=Halolamina sp. CBA1230 TaxID=1853690 RepID=UPI0009A1DF35|nr:hypothetical protein [Halolamina sp. CBA1230]QKY19895.1 zinc ribbon domain-containing protein [Halolamina sp. CBA1230]
MALVPERLRPYLAGLLGTVATGFGQFYLRRWLRGFGWLALAFVVTVAFVPDGTLAAMGAGEAMADSSELFPTMAVQFAGAFDAFLLAYRNRDRNDDASPADRVPADVDVPVVSEDDPDTVSCPNCGKEVDADLDFCHWCTTEFTSSESD